MDERATGIIVRTRLLTETSLIVSWLTPDFGRLGTVAKGARRPKSPFLGKLDLFYLAEFSFHRSRSSELHILREVSVQEYHHGLRGGLGYLQQASYFAQLLEQTTETGTPLPALYELFRQILETLPQAPPRPLTVYAFEMRLLTDLGLTPDLGQSGLSPGARQILHVAGEADWPALSRFRISRAQSDELDQFLRGFLVYHFGKAPLARSLAVNAAEC
jgi:DNA repair protein RecO (recombination protein O)